MSDNEDLFADSDASDDTDDLLKNSRLKKKKAPAAKKKVPQKIVTKKKDKGDDDDDDDDDDGKGLFDSDSEDEAPKQQQQQPKKALSKREKLEALAKRNRKETDDKPAASTTKSNKDSTEKTDKGYDSGDTYDSGEFQRTKEDDDFLDTTGEDAEDVKELYKEQHFDDERPESGDEGYKKQKKRKIRYDDNDHRPRSGGDDMGGGDAEPDNPIMAAVHRMKKKKREKKSGSVIEEECKEFLGRMQMAAEEDEVAVAERRPALAKLAMLQETVDMLTNLEMQRMLLELDLLSVCRKWIQPLPNGKLGNVTVRQKLLTAIANMTGESGITANDLKRSEFGKTVMVLFKHRSETPGMKRQLKQLIEQWSRPIFQKSGNMRDLGRVSRGEGGLAALSRQQQRAEQLAARATPQNRAGGQQDLDSLIESGKKGGADSGVTRVRVPFSKGFAYSVRPQDRHVPEEMARGRGGPSKDTRGKLSKRMLEKGRAVSKNQRSANISIEGRPTK